MIFICSGFSSFADSSSVKSPIEGFWLTRKDDSHLPSSIIQLSIDDDGKMIGKVVVGFYETDEPLPSRTCQKCSSKTVDGRFGMRKNQEIVGSYPVWGFQKKDDDTWGGGKVVRVKTGQTFKADLLLKSSNFLSVKVYYGIFSTSLSWEKVTQAELDDICAGNVSRITDDKDVRSFCVSEFRQK